MKSKTIIYKFIISLVFLFVTSFSLPNKLVHAESYGLSNPRVQKNNTTWDCVYFGRYWQSNTNKDNEVNKKDKKQPIKWRVLSVTGNDAFVVSDSILDSLVYDVSLQSTEWKYCYSTTLVNSNTSIQ